MLILLNIIIIIFLLGMAALWATYGFFSGFLQLLAVIVGGVIALAVWEPLTFWLLGKMPEYAHGIGLLAPFAISLIVMRVLLDKYCKMNLHLPRLADQIGGAACGVAAGVLAFGMFLNGANYLPIEPDAMGYKPFIFDNNDVKENEEGQLWTFTRVNEWSAGFYTMLSGGAMHPTGGTPLAVARPDLAKSASLFRLQSDPNQMKSATPEGLQVAGVYSIPANEANLKYLVTRTAILPFLAPSYKLPEQIDSQPDGRGLIRAVMADARNRESDPDTHGKLSELINTEAIMDAARTEQLKFDNPTSIDNLEAFFNLAADKLGDDLVERMKPALGEGNNLWVVDTIWTKGEPSSPYNSNDNKLRVAIPQIRLQVRTGPGETADDFELLPPVGYSIQYSPNTGARTFTEIVSSQHYAAYSPDPELKMGWVFVVPEGQAPVRFFGRSLRFDLTQLPPVEGQDNAVNVDPTQVAMVLGSPRVPSAPAEAGPSENPGTAVSGTQIGTTGVYAEINERLPRTLSANRAGSITTEKSTEPWTLNYGRQTNVTAKGDGGKRTNLREIYVGDDERLLRLRVESTSAQSLYGRARAAAADLGVMTIKDSFGNDHQAIGYILERASTWDIDIRAQAHNGGLRASELPPFGEGETLYVYFSVPVGRELMGYNLGGDVAEFEQPLTVEGK